MNFTDFKPIKDSENAQNAGRRRSFGILPCSRDPFTETQEESNEKRQKIKQQGKRGSFPRNVSDMADRNGDILYQHKARFLMRRSSSAMRVRELRDVLSDLTSRCDTPSQEDEVMGSQKARLLVASQQRLISRLQDLRHQLDSMDNEVTRVKCDIMNSRRYFSAMTGIPYGPDWSLNRQMDSAYTSPTSYLSPSSEGSPSPYSSDTDSSSANKNGTRSRLINSQSRLPLEQFDDLADLSSGQSLSRSDSCSSFLSWRSDVELAGVFPEEADPASVEAYKCMSAKKAEKHHLAK